MKTTELSISVKALQAAMSSAAPMSQAQMRRYINRICKTVKLVPRDPWPELTPRQKKQLYTAGMAALRAHFPRFFVNRKNQTDNGGNLFIRNFLCASVGNIQEMFDLIAQSLSSGRDSDLTFYFGNRFNRHVSARSKRVNAPLHKFVIKVHITEATHFKPIWRIK